MQEINKAQRLIENMTPEEREQMEAHTTALFTDKLVQEKDRAFPTDRVRKATKAEKKQAKRDRRILG